jgi:hypothetical protein
MSWELLLNLILPQSIIKSLEVEGLLFVSIWVPSPPRSSIVHDLSYVFCPFYISCCPQLGSRMSSCGMWVWISRKFCPFRYRKPPGLKTDLTKIKPPHSILTLKQQAQIIEKDAKSSIKYYQTESSKISEWSFTMTKLASFQGCRIGSTYTNQCNTAH